jgi:AcrR family transcriptional regulator
LLVVADQVVGHQRAGPLLVGEPEVGPESGTDLSGGDAGRAEAALGHADPADPGSVVGAFERLAGELLSYAQVNRRLYHILFQEAGGHEGYTVGQLHHLVRCLLSEAMDQGALSPADPELLARFLLAGLHAVLLPLAHEDRPDREHALTSLSQLLRRLLGPATHAAAP